MNSAEHKACAEEILETLDVQEFRLPGERRELIMIAQVHATLATIPDTDTAAAAEALGASIQRGLGQSARGQTAYMGDFTRYAAEGGER